MASPSGVLGEADSIGEAIGNALSNRNFGRIGAIMAGLLSATFFGGIAEVIQSGITAFIVRPLRSLGSFLNAFITGLLNALGTPSTVQAGVDAFLESLGPFAFVGSLVLVILGAWAVSEVLSRRG